MFISSASLVSEPLHFWVDRINKQYTDRAPQVFRDRKGGDAWVIEGQGAREVPSDLYGGNGRENRTPFWQTYDGTPGTGTAQHRVAVQDRAFWAGTGIPYCVSWDESDLPGLNHSVLLELSGIRSALVFKDLKEPLAQRKKC